MSKSNQIKIVGANEHNLKNVSLSIPRDTLTVFTGVSGSGKSSLAFDTIFKEGQRRFVESLSSYARQFLGQTEKPQLEHIEGVGPTISVDQKTVNRNPRSTVGTITEIYDHYRLLFSRLGTPYCPNCDIPITTQTPDQITDYAYLDALNEKCLILAPMVQERKGEYRKELAEWAAEGFLRARIDGEIRRLDEDIELKRYEKHSIELIMDRLTLSPKEKSRFTEGVEKALQWGKGMAVLHYNGKDHFFSQLFACPQCQMSIPEMEPRLFSFNAPQGACSSCKGIGQQSLFEEDKLCDPHKSIEDNPLLCVGPRGNILFTRIDITHFKAAAKLLKMDLKTPWGELPQEQRDLFLNGNADVPLGISNVFKYSGMLKKRIQQGEWAGIVPILHFVNKFAKKVLEKYQHVIECPDCHGDRLNPVALAVQFQEHTIKTLTTLSIEESLKFFTALQLEAKQQVIGKDIIREIQSRLGFLNEVGVGYLNLNRSAATLSGGEGQRIRLASQVGSGLQGVLYVLDEPSIGLHQSDNQRLIHTLKHLRDKGNTVFVVEHDEETIVSADHVIDVGPTAGRTGGSVISQGSVKDLLKAKDSLTGQYLSKKLEIAVPEQRRPLDQGQIALEGATLNNLQDVSIRIPLNAFVAVAGVSGSGKSSLIDGTLKKALAQHLNKSEVTPGPYKKLTGIEQIDRMIEIDQSPIGRTPRSNPVTYTKVFDEIRDLFTQVPESKARGYQKGRFSFNVKGGRCEECQGAGVQTIEMQFLNDVQIPCETCQGRRFNTETLQIRYKGKNIYDVLEMTVNQAVSFFENQPKIFKTLKTLQDVGLGYIHLGQPSTTLSGGEAQRVKLASELRKRATGKTLYLLDEPTTGLHFHDIQMLLNCLNALVEQGNTVLVIEHNLDMLKVADYVIELGPGGGKYGGQVICEGTPEQMSQDPKSLTGPFLKPMLAHQPLVPIGTQKSLKAQKKQEPPRDIVIKGASKNNLKHIDVTIPAHKLTVITGVSGSGKTSLAFDTIFAEGQARYLESLSTYARRFLGRMDKAPVDRIDGLAPAIAINQKNRSQNPRSNVATTTEIYDYLRILFARIGKAHCPTTGQALQSHTPSAAAKEVVQQFAGQSVLLLAPLYWSQASKKTFLLDPQSLPGLLDEITKAGFTRLQINDEIYKIESQSKDILKLLKKRKLHIDLVIDRINIKTSVQTRLAEGFEQAFEWGEGLAKLWDVEAKKAHFFSEIPACVESGFYQENPLTPRMFSFNSHVGACEACDGLGVINTRYAESKKNQCPECHGERLKPEYRSVHIAGESIMQFCDHSILEAQATLKQWKLSTNEKKVAEQAIQEIEGRLKFLADVGLGYLKLSQSAATLSGGEAQRIRLASQIGSGLVGVMYVLDEPTIGLHPKDISRLLKTLHHLRDLGNTVILVEHDLDTIRSADHLIDIGPGSGSYGGEVIAAGSPKQVQRAKKSLIGKYLSQRERIEVPEARRPISWDQCIEVRGAQEHNLKDIDVKIPLRAMTVVTGVSGSGKSSLVVDILQHHLQKKLNGARVSVGKHRKVLGIEHIDKCMVIDQEPIGSTCRSTPATYTKLLDGIRNLFAKLPAAKARGFKPGRFSFNSKQGRCSTCEGQGQLQIEMHFLSDVWVRCDQCKGQRYNRETLAVTYKGHTIADVLNLEAHQALELFENQKNLARICQSLVDVGLGYMKLGQGGHTLSGGEAQRLKLATELGKRATGNTLYVLDEPTTGLHIDDVRKLLKVLHRLADEGNTILMIEHDLDVIKTADYLIDLGPEGGKHGGTLVACGSPEDMLQYKQSYTAQHLKPLLE